MVNQSDQNSTVPKQSPTGMSANQATITFSIPEENLHVMPRQYQAAKSHAKVHNEGRSGNGKFFLLIGGLAIILGAIIVGLLLYVRSQQSPPPSQPVTTTVDTSNTNSPIAIATTTPNTTQTTPEGRDAIRVKDITTIQQALTSYFSENRLYPQVLAGLPQKFLLTEPKDPLTSEPYVYGVDLNGQSYYIQFMVERQAIFNNKTLEPGLHQITPEGVANTSPTTPVVPVTPNPSIGDASDTDSDGLTSAEELSFRTSVDNPDTDGDGYKDGEEVANLFSPIAGQRAFLNNSGLVRLYKNGTYGYSAWIPQDWVDRSLDTNNQEAVLTSPAGDSVVVTIEQYTGSGGIEQWYTTTFGATAASSARRLTIAAQPALESADGLSWYLLDGQNLYRVSYDATSGSVRYPTVFLLIRQTFSLIPV